MPSQRSEEGNDLRCSHCPLYQLEVDVPEADTRDRRQLVPSEAVLQHRGLALGRPRPHTMRPLRDARFVYEDNDAAFSGSLFLSAGQLLVFHRRTAASSRCMARPLGRWLEKPSRLSRRHTPDSQYRWPVSVSISLPTRPKVHRSLLYPCANAPTLSAVIRRFWSFAFNSGGRPVRAAPRKPRRPSAASARCHRITDVRLTFRWRATSAGRMPRRNNLPPSMRRSSNSDWANRFDIHHPTAPQSLYCEVRIVTRFVKAQ